jgi:exodeoxyribonuclease VII large subunit
VELILLVRGGGSIEDLWCFNDEALARLIDFMKKPVGAGIGHYIDYIIADLVADVRAPTPSAAAELIAPDAADLRMAVDNATRSLAQTTQRSLRERQQSLDRLFDGRMLRDAVELARDWQQGCDLLSQRMLSSVTERTHGSARTISGARQLWHAEKLSAMLAPLQRRLALTGQHLPQLSGALLRQARFRQEDRVRAVEAQRRALDALNPARPLEAGFALVWQELADGSRRLVRDRSEVAPGEKLELQLRRGSLRVHSDD